MAPSRSRCWGGTTLPIKCLQRSIQRRAMTLEHPGHLAHRAALVHQPAGEDELLRSQLRRAPKPHAPLPGGDPARAGPLVYKRPLELGGMRCTAYRRVRTRADPGAHPLRHRRCQSPGQAPGPPARATAEVGSPRAQSARSRRPGAQLPPGRARSWAQQEHRRGCRQTGSIVMHDFDVMARCA